MNDAKRARVLLVSFIVLTVTFAILLASALVEAVLQPSVWHWVWATILLAVLVMQAWAWRVEYKPRIQQLRRSGFAGSGEEG
jgi:hypothetical protein